MNVNFGSKSNLLENWLVLTYRFLDDAYFAQSQQECSGNKSISKKCYICVHLSTHFSGVLFKVR